MFFLAVRAIDKGSKESTDITWRKKSMRLHVNEVAFRGDTQLPIALKELKTPMALFNYFFDDEIINLIVEETNMAARQKNINTTFVVSNPEIRHYIGIAILPDRGLNEHFQSEIINKVVKKVDEVMVEGSGFTLSKIDLLRVQIFKYEPLRGSGFIELPKILKNKKSIVNLKNTGDECFKWSILAALHYNEVYAENRNKVKNATSYIRWTNELNFNGIEFPVQLDQIDKFMQQNEGIAVNVYYFVSEKKTFMSSVSSFETS